MSIETHHSIILDEISNTPVIGTPNMEDYGRKNGYALRFLYSLGTLTEEELTDAVSKAAEKEGLNYGDDNLIENQKNCLMNPRQQ